jgi:hypothetical protein
MAMHRRHPLNFTLDIPDAFNRLNPLSLKGFQADVPLEISPNHFLRANAATGSTHFLMTLTHKLKKGLRNFNPQPGLSRRAFRIALDQFKKDNHLHFPPAPRSSSTWKVETFALRKDGKLCRPLNRL